MKLIFKYICKYRIHFNLAEVVVQKNNPLILIKIHANNRGKMLKKSSRLDRRDGEMYTKRDCKSHLVMTDEIFLNFGSSVFELLILNFNSAKFTCILMLNHTGIDIQLKL